jgi:hypothetical protein
MPAGRLRRSADRSWAPERPPGNGVPGRSEVPGGRVRRSRPGPGPNTDLGQACRPRQGTSSPLLSVSVQRPRYRYETIVCCSAVRSSPRASPCRYRPGIWPKSRQALAQSSARYLRVSAPRLRHSRHVNSPVRPVRPPGVPAHPGPIRIARSGKELFQQPVHGTAFVVGVHRAADRYPLVRASRRRVRGPGTPRPDRWAAPTRGRRSSARRRTGAGPGHG